MCGVRVKIVVEERGNWGESVVRVRYERKMGVDEVVNLRVVYMEMDDFRVVRIFGRKRSNRVGERDRNRDEEMRVVSVDVGRIGRVDREDRVGGMMKVGGDVGEEEKMGRIEGGGRGMGGMGM